MRRVVSLLVLALLPTSALAADDLAARLRAVPAGDGWDDRVKALLVAAADRDGSGRVDTEAEVAAVDCPAWRAIDSGVAARNLSSLDVAYGFDPDLIFVGWAIGIDDDVRATVHARLGSCARGGWAATAPAIVAAPAPGVLATRLAGLGASKADGWDDAVKDVLVGALDRDASGAIDTAAELDGMDCASWRALEADVRRDWSSGLGTIYGFDDGFIWVGYALGFDASLRVPAAARLAACLAEPVAPVAPAPVAVAAARREPAHVADALQLYSTYDLAGDAALLRALREQAPGLADDVLAFGNERAWPAGIATFGAREASRSSWPRYRVWRIAHVGNVDVVVAPAAENGHMPADMRPVHDLYFLFAPGGIEVGRLFEPPATSVAPRTDAVVAGPVVGRRAHIVDSMQLYSTYDLAGDAGALAALRAVSPRLAADVLAWGREASWPAGIASLDARDAHRSAIPAYRVWSVARIGDIDVVVAPEAENRHLADALRPSHDLYLLFGPGGVSVTGEPETLTTLRPSAAP